MKAYDPTAFFDFLGYGTGDQVYDCPGLRSLSVYCRGDAAQLETLLEPMPFELADDRFLVSIADFSNNSGMVYYDAAIILAVRYGDHVGGSYYYEWEDTHVSVSGGRELWGYPKHFALISLEEREGGVTGHVGLEGATAFDVDLTFEDAVDGSAWSDISFYPHLQVRAVPEVNGPGFQSFDIISRNTAKDFELTSRRYGRAEVRFGPEIVAGDEPLRIVETLGADYTIGDFHATRENGTPDDRRLARLSPRRPARWCGFGRKAPAKPRHRAETAPRSARTRDACGWRASACRRRAPRPTLGV